LSDDAIIIRGQAISADGGDTPFGLGEGDRMGQSPKPVPGPRAESPNRPQHEDCQLLAKSSQKDDQR